MSDLGPDIERDGYVADYRPDVDRDEAAVRAAMWAKQPGRNHLERDHDDYDFTMEQGKEALARLAEQARAAEQADELLALYQDRDGDGKTGWEKRAERLTEVLSKVIDAGVETWHTVVNDEPRLASWLGLTDFEYKAYVEGGVQALAESGDE